MNVDFGATASDYSRHRAGFPDSFFERIADYRIGSKGQALLDVGTGSLSAEAVESFDRALGKLLARDFDSERLPIPHRIFAVVATPPER